MEQIELIEWLKPKKFNPDVHLIIKARFNYGCQLCYRKYFKGEYIIWNPEKKKGRHIDCKAVKNRNKPDLKGHVHRKRRL